MMNPMLDDAMTSLCMSPLEQALSEIEALKRRLDDTDHTISMLQARNTYVLSLLETRIESLERER